MAAGLSLKRSELEGFRRAVNEYAFKNMSAEALIPAIEATRRLNFQSFQ